MTRAAARGRSATPDLKIAADFYNFNMQQHDGKLEAVMLGKMLTEGERKCMVWDIERGAANQIEPLPWETDTCIGNWHYDRSLYDQNRYKSAKTVIQMLCDIVSKNGNLLLNIPVRGDGTIDDKEEAVLEGIAAWMDVNKECIFGTRPWKILAKARRREARRFGAGLQREQGQAEFRRRFAFHEQGQCALCHRTGWPTNAVAIKSLGKSAGLLDKSIRNIELLGGNKKRGGRPTSRNAADAKWCREKTHLDANRRRAGHPAARKQTERHRHRLQDHFAAIRNHHEINWKEQSRQPCRLPALRNHAETSAGLVEAFIWIWRRSRRRNGRLKFYSTAFLPEPGPARNILSIPANSRPQP